ncbi:hypothetical protein BELL_0097g00030 [Botrytis elliptica]|uniref:Rhodopsin domain-containing protein n=1 Tax=Botrytis elliptica TaxID=278938 RepID=A0A4Z1JUV4_9HELO|nr:hypothetical protein BELL_0097g00030 [Botrytis elliptica]
MSELEFDLSIPNESRSGELYAVIIVVTILLIITTTARVITKWKHGLKYTWDDYLIVLGTLLNLVGNAFDLVAIKSGFGRHEQYLHPLALITCAKYSQLAVCIAGLAICAIKCSVCFFLLNIIKGTHRRFTISIYILLAFTVVSSFISLLLWGLQATPIEKLWDPRVKGTKVSGKRFLAVVYIFYAFGVFTDVVYSLSPIYFLWNIKIDLQRKLTILALTGSGLLLTIVAFLNIHYAPAFLAPDATWALVNEFICDIIERNMSGVIVNLPALWHLVQRNKPVVSSFEGSVGYYGRSGGLGNSGIGSGLGMGIGGKREREMLGSMDEEREIIWKNADGERVVVKEDRRFGNGNGNGNGDGDSGNSVPLRTRTDIHIREGV